MPTDVLMPQMGESIAEGTIVRWIKKVGETVDRDEPLFEISTDKVDAEIPAPAGGVLAQIRAEVGETVPVNTIVAVIGGEGEKVAPAPARFDASPSAPGSASDAGPSGPAAPAGAAGATPSRKLSPVVRRLAAQHDVDLTAIVGTGEGGRVTKADVLKFVDGRSGAPGDSSAPAPVAISGSGGRVEPMSVMRQRIAEHMAGSRRTAAHVHTVFEVDFSGIAEARAAHPASDVPGYLSYIAKTVADALVEMPIINASVDGKNVVHREQVNLGIAVALDWGLIVPVIKQADRLTVDEIDVAINDLATRARSKQLTPADVEGGTFTITNPGGFGSVFGMPIINQPQSAILCVGAIEKRPVVVDDAVVARLRAFLTLGFDHRLIDGAVADQFLARVKKALETFS